MGRKENISQSFYETVKKNLINDAKKTPQTIKQLAEKYPLTNDRIRRILVLNKIFYIKGNSGPKEKAIRNPYYTDNALWHGLADRVTEIRIEKRLTQDQFELLTKTSSRNMERGLCDVSISVIEKIADAFNVSPAWLAFGLGPRKLRNKIK